jgi:hypothetical protein
MPKVVASEIGTAQIPYRFGGAGGCRAGTSRVTNRAASGIPLESGAKERDSRVNESGPDSKPVPEYRGARETLRESGRTVSQG